MANIFKTPQKRQDKQTRKMFTVRDGKGEPVMTSLWRTVIFDHTGKRKMFTLTAGKRESQAQANMIEARESEIRNGLPPKPDKASHPFDKVFSTYMTWGRVQGGRRGLPWSAEYASHKERDIEFWRSALGLERMSDAKNILPKVESECHRLLASGNSGKTVWSKAQNLNAYLTWCKKRNYLSENSLAVLVKFDTESTFTRRAMTVAEYTILLSVCVPHRRLLYEVAACSGLRESEFRALEPRRLDLVGLALKVERKVDKGWKKCYQPIPAALVEQLDAYVAYVASGEVKRIYAHIYKAQGKRPNRRQPPKDPLLYVPYNSATLLKKDLDAASCLKRRKDDWISMRCGQRSSIL